MMKNSKDGFRQDQQAGDKKGYNEHYNTATSQQVQAIAQVKVADIFFKTSHLRMNGSKFTFQALPGYLDGF